jgi:uncharacterized membrane protein
MASKRGRTTTRQQPAANRGNKTPVKTPGRNTAAATGRPAPKGTAQSGLAQNGAARISAKAAALPGRPAPKAWFQITTLVLSLIGLADAIYLTIAHFTASTILACPANSFVNCGEVTSSSESEVFGVLPVAVLGLAFFVFMVAINSPWAWRWQARQPLIHWARVGSIVVGMGFVLYLLYAELIQIGKLCEYCTGVHIITFILFVFIVFNATSSPEPAP